MVNQAAKAKLVDAVERVKAPRVDHRLNVGGSTAKKIGKGHA